MAVIIPCLDEEEAISPLLAEIIAQGLTNIIVVDGGSRDATVARAKSAGAIVVTQPVKGYGRACASGIAAAASEADYFLFLDGDGSDNPEYIPEILGPLLNGQADFVMGSRMFGAREAGSLNVQQIVAGRLAGWLMRGLYGVRFTDMSPFRALSRATLAQLSMQDMTFGWNLEMQMQVAALNLNITEVAVGCRKRRGGLSKVSGNFKAGLKAAVTIVITFLKLAWVLRSSSWRLRKKATR
ncbi:MAG: glycosyltransferase [Hyphomicrobiales bacterium]|nr:glycosyltransferase [Hyphomicrobiales bacterium]MDE2114869.1 glycosyltransferase [Hyphomicrobiales bacterium]